MFINVKLILNNNQIYTDYFTIPNWKWCKNNQELQLTWLYYKFNAGEKYVIKNLLKIQNSENKKRKPIEKKDNGDKKLEINLTVIQYTIKSTKNTGYVFIK